MAHYDDSLWWVTHLKKLNFIFKNQILLFEIFDFFFEILNFIFKKVKFIQNSFKWFIEIGTVAATDRVGQHHAWIQYQLNYVR